MWLTLFSSPTKSGEVMLRSMVFFLLQRFFFLLLLFLSNFLYYIYRLPMLSLCFLVKTSIAAKVYNALLHNHMTPESENIVRKNQNGFQRNWSTTSLILTIIKGVHAKNLDATLLFVDFSKTFHSIHRGKMDQILLAYGLPKEIVTSQGVVTRWRHRLLWHCCWNSARKYISTISVYNLPRLYTSNVDWYN